jgi:hypothetical protein
MHLYTISSNSKRVNVPQMVSVIYAKKEVYTSVICDPEGEGRLDEERGIHFCALCSVHHYQHLRQCYCDFPGALYFIFLQPEFKIIAS